MKLTLSDVLREHGKALDAGRVRTHNGLTLRRLDDGRIGVCYEKRGKFHGTGTCTPAPMGLPYGGGYSIAEDEAPRTAN